MKTHTLFLKSAHKLVLASVLALVSAGAALPAQAANPLWLNSLTGDEYLQKPVSETPKAQSQKAKSKKQTAKKAAKKKKTLAKKPRAIKGTTFTKLQPAAQQPKAEKIQKPVVAQVVSPAATTAVPQKMISSNTSSVNFTKRSTRNFLSRVSMMAGGQVSQVWDSQQEALSQTNHFGFGGGVLADVIGNDVSIETGVLYKMMGGTALALFNGVPGEISFDLDYLQFPVALKYYFSGPKRTTLFAKVGASYSQLIRKQAEATVGNQVIATDEISGLAQGEFGALLGLGASIKMGDRTYLLLEASGYRAFSKLTVSENTIDLYNQSINLTSGLAIEL